MRIDYSERRYIRGFVSCPSLVTLEVLVLHPPLPLSANDAFPTAPMQCKNTRLSLGQITRKRQTVHYQGIKPDPRKHKNSKETDCVARAGSITTRHPRRRAASSDNEAALDRQRDLLAVDDLPLF